MEVLFRHLADGVRTTETLEGKPEQWYGLDTGLAVTPEALEWAANEDGQSYATLLAIVSGAISRLESPAPGDVHALFCSMAFTEFCDRCGGNLGMKRPCPHVLATQLRLVGALPYELPAGLFAAAGQCEVFSVQSPEN